MMKSHDTGFVELDHTADWSIRVWAPDLLQLFVQSARAMYILTAAQMLEEPHHETPVRLEAPDPESLLVAFLNELLYLLESQQLGFERFDMQIDGAHLEGRMYGRRVASQAKEIKAVTFHGLDISRSSRGLEATIVFDV